MPISGVHGSSESLTLAEVHARLNGAEAKVTNLRGPGSDLLILLVFDVAGDLSLVEPAKQALAERLRTLPPNVYTGVMRTNDGAQVILDPSPDRDAIITAIQSVPVSGKAGLLDSLVTTTQIADAVSVKSGVRTAVLYLTDSEVSNYREDFTNPVVNSSDSRDLSRRFPEGLVRQKISTLQAQLEPLQAPFFFIHLNYRGDRLNQAYQTGISQLAQLTGGVGLFCRSSTEVADNINRAIDSVLAHYVAFVQVPVTIERNVLVELSGGPRDLTYRTRFVLP